MVEEQRSTAIRIDGCGDVALEGNVSIGYDRLAHVTNTKKLRVNDNVAILSLKGPEVADVAREAIAQLSKVRGSVRADLEPIFNEILAETQKDKPAPGKLAELLASARAAAEGAAGDVAAMGIVQLIGKLFGP